MDPQDQTTNNENENPLDEESRTEEIFDPRDEEISQLKDQLARAVAELDNYRKSVERERIESAKFSNASTLTALLPVLDNFSRAAAARPESLAEDEWARGIESIEKQLEQALESLGLQKIKVEVGEACDPSRHEVVLTGEGEPGTILDVLEDGYEINGRVLRAAKVRVGK